MKQPPQRAARRYAKALLDVALAQGDAAPLLAELRQADRLVGGNRELRAALLHPGLGGERRQRLLAAVFGEASAVLRRLMALLADRNRVALLPHIAEAFAEAWNEHRGVVSARAVSAIALEKDQEQRLAAALREATGREVELTTAVDPAVLGGLVVSFGGRTYDGSVRGRLEGLRRTLGLGAGR